MLEGLKFTVAFEEFDLNTVSTDAVQWIPAGKTNQVRVHAHFDVRQSLLSLLVTGGFKLQAKGSNAWEALEKWWIGIPELRDPGVRSTAGPPCSPPTGWSRWSPSRRHSPETGPAVFQTSPPNDGSRPPLPSWLSIRARDRNRSRAGRLACQPCSPGPRPSQSDNAVSIRSVIQYVHYSWIGITTRIIPGFGPPKNNPIEDSNDGTA